MRSQNYLSYRKLRILYYRYKDTPLYSLAIFGITIFVCLILFWKAVLPQLQEWFSIQREIAATKERIKIVNSNLNFIASLDTNKLAENLRVASLAMPGEKDFVGFLGVLALSATNSNVLINDYSLKIGQITSKNAAKTLSPFSLKISATGGLYNIKRFIDEIEQKLPLTQVSQVSYSGSGAELTLDFYYKPFPMVVVNRETDTTPLLPVSSANKNLLEKLSTWELPKFDTTSLDTASSSSFPPPF